MSADVGVQIPLGVNFLAAGRFPFYARDAFYYCFWLFMASKKSPPDPSRSPAPQPAALPLDSMPTVSARSPQSLDEEATLIYGSTKGAAGRLQIEEGSHAGEEVLLSNEPCVIGRSSECALVLRRSAGISRKHAQVVNESGRFYVEDLGSRNGTKLNGQRITGRSPLNDGDQIGISSEKIRFIGPPIQAAEKRAAAAPQKPSAQETALVEEPQLQALLAASARSDDDKDAEVDARPDEFSEAETSLQRSQPDAPRQASAPTLSGEFDAGMPTSTDAAPTRAKAAPPPPAALPSPTSSASPPPTNDHTDRRKAPAPQRSTSTPAAERPYSAPKKASLGLPLALASLVCVMAAFAYDFGLNDAAIFNSFFGESETPFMPSQGLGAEAGNQVPASTTNNEPPDTNANQGAATTAPGEKSAPTSSQAENKENVVPAAKTTTVAPAPNKQPSAGNAGAQQNTRPAAQATLQKGALVPVTSLYTGVVGEISVQVGSRVRAGQVIATISRLPAAQARKKRALRREEKLFAPLAAKGDVRAARDLADVRKELRSVEASRQRNTVQAPIAGTVRDINVHNGQSVGKDTALIVIAHD